MFDKDYVQTQRAEITYYESVLIMWKRKLDWWWQYIFIMLLTVPLKLKA